MGGEQGADGGGESDAAVFVIFRGVLHREALPGGGVAGDPFDRAASHGQRPRVGVEVGGAQFGQFAPAQPGLDVEFGEQPRRWRRQGGVDRVELFGREDGADLARYRSSDPISSTQIRLST